MIEGMEQADEEKPPVRLHTRQYSISTLEDFRNVENGRCPEYALQWDLSTNALYWPVGHDYYMGNGLNIVDNFERRLVLSKRLRLYATPFKF